LTRTYGTGAATVLALSEVSFTIEPGEFVAVMGESGAGKSTLLSLMGAMNRPSSGLYTVDGIDVYGLDQERRADFRREYLGFIFQSFHLISYLNVIENVMLPLTTMRLSPKEKQSKAMQALGRVGLESKAARLPGQLSGGEQERVAVARAIVNDPPILLADEPTGNLDSRNSREVMQLLGELNAGGTTIIMVTHSMECAEHARRRMEMADGGLVHEHRHTAARAA
jgi:putative ABC transport system ATP-binding protein